MDKETSLSIKKDELRSKVEQILSSVIDADFKKHFELMLLQLDEIPEDEQHMQLDEIISWTDDWINHKSDIDKQFEALIYRQKLLEHGEISEEVFRSQLEEFLQCSLKKIQQYGYPKDVEDLFEKLDSRGILKKDKLIDYVRKYDIYFRQGGWI